MAHGSVDFPESLFHWNPYPTLDPRMREAPSFDGPLLLLRSVVGRHFRRVLCQAGLVPQHEKSLQIELGLSGDLRLGLFDGNLRLVDFVGLGL